MSVTSPLRKIGKYTIQQMLEHRRGRSAIVGMMLSKHLWTLPSQTRQPLLLHVSEYTRHHPEFFEELKVRFGAKDNDEFQAVFWGSGFGWMLQDSDEMFYKKYSYFRDATSELRAARYLDVGCGQGSLCLWIKKNYPDAEVFGLDISKGVLETARRRAKEQNLDITFLNGPATGLIDQFGPKSIDVVSCTDAFLYLEDGIGALQQMSQVARKCVF